jgi:hypothetical protein
VQLDYEGDGSCWCSFNLLSNLVAKESVVCWEQERRRVQVTEEREVFAVGVYWQGFSRIEWMVESYRGKRSEVRAGQDSGQREESEVEECVVRDEEEKRGEGWEGCRACVLSVYRMLVRASGRKLQKDMEHREGNGGRKDEIARKEGSTIEMR